VTVTVSGVTTAATVPFCTLARFAFGKMRFRGRNPLFAITLGTMMVPPSLAVVPLYSVLADLGPAGELSSVRGRCPDHGRCGEGLRPADVRGRT
jgi:cellobiose transport system permease protein